MGTYEVTAPGSFVVNGKAVVAREDAVGQTIELDDNSAGIVPHLLRRLNADPDAAGLVEQPAEPPAEDVTDEPADSPDVQAAEHADEPTAEDSAPKPRGRRRSADGEN